MTAAPTSSPIDDGNPVAPTPALPFGPLVKAIGAPLRLRILRELASGERMMVVEIAQRLRMPATLISKHLAMLRRVGLVDTRQRLYFLPRHFIVDGGGRTLDLGFCVLKLDQIAG